MRLFGGNDGGAAHPPMPSPLDGLGDDNPLGLQADEMVARHGDKAKAEADFAELSKQATPHAVFSGQHAESQTVLRLPGKDMYVGYRINKDGLPTIDINSPHTGSIRFHYK